MARSANLASIELKQVDHHHAKELVTHQTTENIRFETEKAKLKRDDIDHDKDAKREVAQFESVSEPHDAEKYEEYIDRLLDQIDREIMMKDMGYGGDIQAKSVIFDAFIGRGIDAPQHLGKVVAGHYFEPTIDDFRPRTMWSLSNAFTSAFKELEPIPQMRGAASLAPFLRK